jgi:branched-chain amino acid transport system ATP-binding protein
VLLKLENVEVFYGVVQVLRSISLDIPQGAIVALLGANGAGKSTTLKTISGLTPILRGNIMFEGRGIRNIVPEKIVQLGITQIPEGRRLFPELKVVENLRMGGSACHDQAKKKESFERVMRYFPVLKERGKQRAGTLSGGEQQMLAIGRGIMANPKLLMIDEPSLGLAPFLVKELMNIIQSLNGDGITILLVEQNARMALSIAEYGYVLELGRISTQGKGSELLVDEKVKRSYLGIR